MIWTERMKNLCQEHSLGKEYQCYFCPFCFKKLKITVKKNFISFNFMGWHTLVETEFSWTPFFQKGEF